MTAPATTIAQRVDRADWPAIACSLDEHGFADLGRLLTDDECDDLVDSYDGPHFRSTIDMARYRFGQGQYRYFARPLPPLVDDLRHALWPPLRRVAQRWAERLGRPAPWDEDLDPWLASCHAAGQTRPTPLLLRYGASDWNALHQDLYGAHVFPLQVVFGLSRPVEQYDGGEFVVVENRPRAQSRASAVTIAQGHAIAFATRERPVASARGWSAVTLRHGVSTVRRGARFTLGIPFHDAT